jgi:ADP-ribose pyrophosphatase YjhB (NUDIX family)
MAGPIPARPPGRRLPGRPPLRNERRIYEHYRIPGTEGQGSALGRGALAYNLAFPREFALSDRFETRVPEGDNRPRQVCTDCGFIHYENPRLIVGTLCRFEDRILLCRRAIDPRSGYWTLPAGFMEMGESTRQGAARETLEEAGVVVEPQQLLAIYDLPHIGQVHLFYLATLDSEKLEPGEESLEAELFHYEDLPWDDLAFPTIRWALRDFRRLGDLSRTFAPYQTPPDDLERMLKH